jgi:pimeloyl-ACP methyl ester carboxylesterase
MSETEVAVVLVHGAWADGSSWNKVIAALRSEEVRAVTAPLPLTSVADDIAALDQALERAGGPVVVAGNAYADAIIGAASADRVVALVYVAALAPDEGETVGDLFYRVEPHELAPVLGPDRHGQIWLPDDAFARAFAPNASALEQALLTATERPLAAACLSDPLPRPVWKDRPSWFSWRRTIA